MAHADHVGCEYYAHDEGAACPRCGVDRFGAQTPPSLVGTTTDAAERREEE